MVFCGPQPILNLRPCKKARSEAHFPGNCDRIDFFNGITVLGSLTNATFGLTMSGADFGPTGFKIFCNGYNEFQLDCKKIKVNLV